jgi:hypothetical protein
MIGKLLCALGLHDPIWEYSKDIIGWYCTNCGILLEVKHTKGLIGELILRRMARKIAAVEKERGQDE